MVWMDPGVIARFSAAACQETRTINEILHSWVQEGASTGGFRQVRGWVWFCWSQHPCLSSVNAAEGDRMCYASNVAEWTFHAMGLSSELDLDLQQCNGRR